MDNRTATKQEVEYAISIIYNLSTDPEFFSEGRRNDDAVDLCIASYITGDDPKLLGQKILAKHNPELSEFAMNNKLMDLNERMDSISKYLPDWRSVSIFSYLIDEYKDIDVVVGQKALDVLRGE